MCFKYITVYCCVYLLCQVSFVECQVTLVKRDVRDEFRIGDEGCKNNQSICTNVGASCLTNSGLCQCDDPNPHFRNPTITTKDTILSYGSSYGCITTEFIQRRIREYIVIYVTFLYVDSFR